jgi:hypothetical protein
MLTIKYTQPFLTKLEELVGESDYILRYEKGSFNSGYCVLKDTKIAIINKFYPLEGKIASLLEIIKAIGIDPEQLSEKNRKLYEEITAPVS